VSASDCWAVGYYINAVTQTLIERWDGTAWAIVSSPNTASGNNFLLGVTCVSASDCWAVGYYQSGVPQTLTEHYAPLTPTSVVSRKIHGTAGDFDIDFPLAGARGVECRSGGATNDYTLLFTFVNTLTSVASASVTNHDPATGTGTVSSNAIGPNPNQYTVNLTNVSTVQYITVTLNSVLDVTGASGNVLSPQMGVLVGDVNANGVVTNADVSLVKAQVAAGGNVDSSNFRDDVNANGVLTNADVSLTKAQVAAGAQLPTPP
jgi:hypothetical protein